MSVNDDKLSYGEFRKVCEAAGVEGNDAEMAQDYATGQVVGDLIDLLCIKAEEGAADEDTDTLVGSCRGVETLSYNGALDLAARLVRWATDNMPEETGEEDADGDVD